MNGIRIETGDFREMSEYMADNSVDAIITDPPYPKEYLSLWADLGRVAARVLKPGCPLVALSGQLYLRDVLNLIASHLTYCWTLAYLTPGGQSPQIWVSKINTFWKPALLFVKGEERAGKWVGDVINSPSNGRDKRFHGWGQNVIGVRQLIERFSSIDDLIFDPMLGGGTTAIACLQTGRRCIGYEINPETADVARRRVADAQLPLFVPEPMAQLALSELSQ